ncbi:MAG: hypothetical protein HXY25_11210 [Alphaproteobacteria bacterium]|nr:hypothetical protein [Alphaproteobacteria bacterium]
MSKDADRIRRPYRSRVVEPAQPGRRAFLRTAALGVAGAPLVAANLASTPVRASATAEIVRDFEDPYLELVRLLREAAEIEHDLMVQYLYCAYSVKPAYSGIIGFAVPRPDSLLGIAVQEMQHLAAVNHLLRALGHRPVLERAGYPHETDLYPFPFKLEPISRVSLAKYAYCEAPPGALDPAKAQTTEDRAFIAMVSRVLGPDLHVNHVGTLYANVIARLAEVRQSPDAPKIDYDRWHADLVRIMQEGEVDHYRFFRNLLMGIHPIFETKATVWDLPYSHADYPGLPLAGDHTAFKGHERTIPDSLSRELAWLSDLTYWSSLLLLTLGYHHESEEVRAVPLQMAQELMLGPLGSLARALPERGYGLPFDQLSLDYHPGTDDAGTKRFILRMLAEADRKKAAVETELPYDFPPDVYAFMAERIRAGEI